MTTLPAWGRRFTVTYKRQNQGHWRLSSDRSGNSSVISANDQEDHKTGPGGIRIMTACERVPDEHQPGAAGKQSVGP